MRGNYFNRKYLAENLLDKVEADEVTDNNDEDDEIKTVKLHVVVDIYSCEDVAFKKIKRDLDKLCSYKFRIWSSIAYSSNDKPNFKHFKIDFEFRENDSFIGVFCDVLMSIVSTFLMVKVKYEIKTIRGSELITYITTGMCSNLQVLSTYLFKSKYSEKDVMKHIAVSAIKNNILKGRDGYYAFLFNHPFDTKYVVVDSKGNQITPERDLCNSGHMVNGVHGDYLVLGSGVSGCNVYDMKNKKFLFENDGDYCRVYEEFGLVVYSEDSSRYSIYSIDKEGFIIENMAEIGKYSEGWFVIKDAERKEQCYNFIDRDGKLMSTKWFRTCRAFSDGCAVVELGDKKKTYVDTNGKFFMKKKFRDCSDFSEGLAFAVKEGDINYDYMVINKKGEFVSDGKYMYRSYFSDGIARVQVDEENYTFIDRTGLPITDKMFQDTSLFEDGLVSVQDEDGWTFMDKNGNFISDERFDEVGDFHNGTAIVETTNEIKVGGESKKVYTKRVIEKDGHALFDSSKLGYGLERAYGKLLVVSKRPNITKMIKASSSSEINGSWNAESMYNYYVIGKGLILDEWIPSRSYDKIKEIIGYGVDSYHIVMDKNGLCNVVSEDGSLVFDKWIDGNVVLKPGGLVKVENDVFLDCKSKEIALFV